MLSSELLVEHLALVFKHPRRMNHHHIQLNLSFSAGDEKLFAVGYFPREERCEEELITFGVVNFEIFSLNALRNHSTAQLFTLEE